jgi:hypothetical protein
MAFSKIVSLWDLMQKLDGSRILEGLAWLSSLQTLWGERGAPQFIDDRVFAIRRTQLEELVLALEEAGLPISANNCREVLRFFVAAEHVDNGRSLSGVTFEGAMHFANKLLSVAPDEAGIRRFLLIAPEYVKLYESDVPAFGPKVAAAFPSLAYEVDEAAKCLALGRSTASAFHTIRCLEGAIRAISRSLGIPDPTKGVERSWMKALGAIESDMNAKWPKATRLSGDGVLFEKWHAQLVALQNPYRNATMHLEEKYTVEEAEHLFAMVKGLMISVAGRLNEDGEPKV